MVIDKILIPTHVNNSGYQKPGLSKKKRTVKVTCTLMIQQENAILGRGERADLRL